MGSRGAGGGGGRGATSWWGFALGYPGAAVSVSCLGLCTTAHVSLTPWHVVGPEVAATARG